MKEDAVAQHPPFPSGGIVRREIADYGRRDTEYSTSGIQDSRSANRDVSDSLAERNQIAVWGKDQKFALTISLISRPVNVLDRQSAEFGL